MNELENRMNKAAKLVDVIRAAGGDSNVAGFMTDVEWSLAEQAAKVNKASEFTRSMVVRFIKIKEDAAATDPFARLRKKK